MQLNYPKIKIDSNKKYYVYFYQRNIRYRLYNGKRIGSKINPNIHEDGVKKKMAELLASEIYNFINSGKLVEDFRTKSIERSRLSDFEYLKSALEEKLNQNYSTKYKNMLLFVFNKLTNNMTCQKLTLETVKKTLARYNNETSYNSVKRHINALINHAVSLGLEKNHAVGIKCKKTKAKLHKPYENIKEILDDIKLFNTNLYICCLMTYGCLLRPHREIRELRWEDFAEDLSSINLSGSRNKSGRNRIVPVPYYIRDILVKGNDSDNIFTNSNSMFNKDYFKSLWSRYKKSSNLISAEQTLYSFRHSGATEIYKRTGSLSKLQKAMGHSSLKVSLTYLRGLEVEDLKEEDMPMIC